MSMSAPSHLPIVVGTSASRSAAALSTAGFCVQRSVHKPWTTPDATSTAAALIVRIVRYIRSVPRRVGGVFEAHRELHSIRWASKTRPTLHAHNLCRRLGGVLIALAGILDRH